MCRADNDVWMRKGTNAQDIPVWEYILIYSDDLLCLARNPKDILMQIDQHFKLKPSSVKVPDQYLGADIGLYTLPDGTTAWYSSPNTYVKSAVENVEQWLSKQQGGQFANMLKTRVASVLPSGYKPELDVSRELPENLIHLYQQHVGILRWIVELGRVDIATEVSMLAAHSALPREGHFGAILHLYAYLKRVSKSKMVYDPTMMAWDAHVDHDWSKFYHKEPHDGGVPGAPEPLGNPVQTTCYVDSDHAGDAVTRRSRTGVIILCNRAPIIFYTKKQGSIETSSFGSELMAMKTAVELVEGL